MTPCSACKTDSAIVIDPPRYVCVVCGETGESSFMGTANVPDAKPDPGLKKLFKELWDERPSMKEFTKVAKRDHRTRLKLVKGEDG